MKFVYVCNDFKDHACTVESIRMLIEKHSDVSVVCDNPLEELHAEFGGAVKGYSLLHDVPAPADAVLVRVTTSDLDRLLTELFRLSPSRVVFLPGSVDESHVALLQAHGILVSFGCLITMIKEGDL